MGGGGCFGDRGKGGGKRSFDNNKGDRGPKGGGKGDRPPRGRGGMDGGPRNDPGKPLGAGPPVMGLGTSPPKGGKDRGFDGFKGKGDGKFDFKGKGDGKFDEFFKGKGKAFFFKGKGKFKGKDRAITFWAEPALKVWLGNLSEGLEWKDLQTHMNQAGKTQWVEVFVGKGKGTGAVVYATAEEAQNAIATLNGSELNGSTIIVDSWVKQEKAPEAEAEAEAEAAPEPP